MPRLPEPVVGDAFEDDLDTRMRLVAFGSEEIGLQGAYHHAESVLELADASRAFPPREPEEIREALTDGYVR